MVMMMLREIENATVSAGAVSNCITAMADHIDGDVLAIPYEEPIILDPVDLRGYRSPAAPPSDIPDTECHARTPFSRSAPACGPRSSPSPPWSG